MNTFSKCAIAALVALAAPACTSEPVADQSVVATGEIDERLAAAMSALEADGFSGFAAVAKDGEMIAFAEAGAADPESGRAYTPTTQFDIGSIVKPITGLAASKLIAEGRLDADATLDTFFDNVPADKAGITLEQLLTHTAGLPAAHGFDLEPMSREEMVAEALSSDLIAEPGERYSYSNTGPSLVAAIIADASGKPYEDYVRQDVLAPLGIEDTGYRSALDPARADASEEYGPMSRASWGDLDPVSWALIGNGGMVSTAEDLLALGQAIANGGVDEKTLETWTTPRVEEGGGTFYGYGIGFQEIDGLGKIHWHNGGNPAFQTEWWTLMDSGITIVVHRNGGEPSLAAALGPVIEAVTGSSLGFADGPADVAMTEGSDLPSSPLGELAREFLAASQADEAGQRAFIESRMSSAMLDQFSMEQHLEMFSSLGAELEGREVSAHGSGEDSIHLQMVREGRSPVRLVISTIAERDELKIVGIGVD